MLKPSLYAVQDVVRAHADDTEDKRRFTGSRRVGLTRIRLDTGLVDGLKVLDPERSIREAAVSNRSKARPYSITSSARASSAGGTVRPSALAVLRFIASSNFVACMTGRSAIFAPLTIFPT